MNCEVKEVGKRNAKGLVRMQCIHCKKIYAPTEDHPDRFTALDCPAFEPGGVRPAKPQSLLSTKELQALFEDEDDPTLIGNQLKNLFESIGMPPCGGCTERATWMNQAHLILRRTTKSILPTG